jgi:hypothetical protein
MLPFDSYRWWSGIIEQYPRQRPLIEMLKDQYMRQGKDQFLLHCLESERLKVYHPFTTAEIKVYQLIQETIFDTLYGWHLEGEIEQILTA